MKIVAFGDSLMVGYELPAENAFPAKLEKALKAKGLDVTVENAGVSGDTASGGLSRIDWSVPEGTQAVILELGGNDMLRAIDPAVTLQALEGILQKLKARNIAVLLCGMRAPPNLGEPFGQRFNAIFPDLAARYDAALYPFFLEGVAAKKELSLKDGMHPNAAGVDAIVAGILPQAEALVARVKSKP